MAKLSSRTINYKAYRAEHKRMTEVQVAEWWLYELRNAAARSEYRERLTVIERSERRSDHHRP